ncbi:MAG: hypothetical protein GY757_51175 [bacterium]|nr:hypothetical protein [bacterium]
MNLTDVFIVITSTWRYRFSLPRLKEIFLEAGIAPHRILDIAPDLRRYEGMIRHYPGRNEEIRAWLEQHPGVGKFVVIDDVDREQMEGFEEHFFETVFEKGLLREQSLEIIKRLTG